MFRECPSTPQRYKDEDNRLSAIYKPIESDPVMSTDDKTKHMIDWYTAAHALLKYVSNKLVNEINCILDTYYNETFIPSWYLLKHLLFSEV